VTMPTTTATPRVTTTVSNRHSIYNAVQRDRVTFLGKRSNASGAYSLHRLDLEPGGGNESHRHAAYTESFEVLSGQLYVEVNGKVRVLEVGDRAFVDRGVPHRFWAEFEAASFSVEIQPPHREETLLRALYGLANDGLTDARGLPKSLWHTALLAHWSETYPARGSLVIHRVAFGMLAIIACWLGKHRDLEKYL
jgi:quercetin dioxygenase-like cupin family protein